MNRLRVALDATSLLGHRAGVGVFTDEVVRRLAGFDDVDLRAFAVTWRGRHDLANGVLSGVETAERPMAARPLRWLADGREAQNRALDGPGRRGPRPELRALPAEAPRVATVHDLTAVRYPEMCTPEVRRWPGLLEKAVQDGAWVHAVSEHVADEVRCVPRRSRPR